MHCKAACKHVLALCTQANVVFKTAATELHLVWVSLSKSEKWTFGWQEIGEARALCFSWNLFLLLTASGLCPIASLVTNVRWCWCTLTSPSGLCSAWCLTVRPQYECNHQGHGWNCVYSQTDWPLTSCLLWSCSMKERHSLVVPRSPLIWTSCKGILIYFMMWLKLVFS